MRAVSLVLPALSLTVLIGCSGDSRRTILSPQLDATSEGAGPSASGHGNWFNAAGEYVSRSFHAREKEPGVVEGSWEYH